MNRLPEADNRAMKFEAYHGGKHITANSAEELKEKLRELDDAQSSNGKSADSDSVN